MSIRGMEKLDVWCRARDFAVCLNKEVLPLLPSEEKWSLSQQLRRSSQSNPDHQVQISNNEYRTPKELI